MKKCKLCGFEFKSDEDAKKHDEYCETCSKKVIKEQQLKDDIAAKVKAEFEEKALREKFEKEAREKYEAEEKAKKEAEELAKKELEGAKNGNKSADDNAARNVSQRRSKKKLDVESEALYEALKSEKATSLEFDMDVDGVESSISDAKEARKADIDGASSYGVEFVPEEWGPGFYFRMGSMHGNLMNQFPKIGMNTDTKNIAEILTKPTISAYSSYSNQNTAIENVTATDITTGDMTLTPKRFVAKINVYNTVLQDEKFGLMRGIQRALSEELATAVSSMILNGDTTATHMDEDYEAAGANIPEAMAKGLRKLTLAGSLGVDGSATYTLANLESVRKMMGKYALGENMRKTKWILGVKTYNELIGLWRASTSTPQAADFALRNGQIESYMGHQIIVSDKQREDLEIDGYYDESGTAAAEGFLSLVNVSQFVIGLRNKLQIKVVPDPLNDRQVVQSTLRLDFQPFEAPSTTITSCAGLYAYTLS